MKKRASLFFFLVVSVWLCSEVMARTTIVIGSLAAAYQYSDRTGETLQTAEDSGVSVSSTEGSGLKGHQISVTPAVTLTSNSAKDSVEVSYKPRFIYDWELEEDDMNHNLTLGGYRKLTNRWFVQVDDHFITADHQDTLAPENENGSDSNKAAETKEGETDQSNKYGSRRYWRNALSCSTKYSFLEGSDVIFQYGYKALRNEVTEDKNDRFRDYDVHSTSLTLSYQYSQQWKVSGSGQYMQGDYFPTNPSDTASDGTTPTTETAASGEGDTSIDDRLVFLQHIQGSLTVDAKIWPHSPLFMTYAYHSYDYDAYKRDDFVIQQLTIGGMYTISPTFTIVLSGGPTLVDPEKREQAWGYNGQAVLNYRFKDGNLKLNVKKGYTKDMFSSVSEETLSDVTSLSADVTIHPLKDLSLIFSGSYKDSRNEKVTIPVEDTTATGNSTAETQQPEKYYEIQYSLGAKLNYKFSQIYTVTFGYQYTDFDSELEGEDYSESLISLTLGVQKELFHW